MDGNRGHELDFQAMIPEWIAAAQTALNTLMSGASPSPGRGADSPPEKGVRPDDAADDTGASPLEAWLRLLSKGLSLQNSAGSLAEDQPMMVLTQQLMQMGVSGASAFQQQWSDQLSRIRPDERSGPDVTQWCAGALKQWMAWQEEEVSQRLKVPPIGIARNYQQDMNQAVETFNRFQAMLADFIFLLCKPVEGSFKTFQKELGQAELSEDLESIYAKWVKTLESQYMRMFQSAEYIQSLAKTIDALNAYTGARNKVLEDVLRTLPIPNNTDMDELYKEIYDLKKRIRTLEKNAFAEQTACQGEQR